ncbi:MAG: MarR family winged helix-turn-helix transcriptional regulator [Propionibacteriaceae bacterium]
MTKNSSSASQLRRYIALTNRELVFTGKKLGIHPTDAAALAYLIDQRKQGRILSAGDLGELLALSGPATTAAIDRLESRGFVTRRSSTSDGRRVEIHLVHEQGEGEAERLFHEFDSITNNVLKKYSAAEIKFFQTLLTEICDSVKQADTQRDA